MIHNAYTIFDRKALIFNTPFYAVNDGSAVRSFSDLVGDMNTQVGRHPADFVLYRCGVFDDSNGLFGAEVPLVHVVDATSLVPRQQSLPFDPRPLHRTGPNGEAVPFNDHE